MELSSSQKRSLKEILFVLCRIIILALIITPALESNFKITIEFNFSQFNGLQPKLQYKGLQFELLILGFFLLLLIITALLKTVYFNDNKRFNKDSLGICLSFIYPVIPLFFYLIYGISIKEAHKYLNDYAFIAAIVIISFSLYLWIIYLFRCRQAITTLNKDKYFFTLKMFKSMLSAILVCFSATLIIESLPGEQNVIKLIYEIVNVSVNAMYPLIDMYTYVRSEIDEFDKREKDKIVKEKRESFNKQKYEMDKKELQTIKKEIEMMKNEVNRKTAKIEYKITHYKNK